MREPSLGAGGVLILESVVCEAMPSHCVAPAAGRAGSSEALVAEARPWHSSRRTHTAPSCWSLTTCVDATIGWLGCMAIADGAAAGTPLGAAHAAQNVTPA